MANSGLTTDYKAMMALSVWKNFEVNILDRIEQQAIRDEDSVPLDELTMIRIAECRGRRQAIAKIRRDLDYIINDLR